MFKNFLKQRYHFVCSFDSALQTLQFIQKTVGGLPIYPQEHAESKN